MATFELKKFSSADETRTFPRGRIELLKVPGGPVARAIMEPGWKWSRDVKPLAGTESCEVTHSIYVLSGRMRVRMDDGQEREIGPGDYAFIPPGHDAWVIGNDACVSLDMMGMADYAKASPETRATSEGASPPTH
jgi:mannose-6-phosphate isomerase-like protein (cupin superfamily)